MIDRIKIFPILTTAVIFLSTRLFAQEVKQLSLQQAIDLSIQNSKNLKISRAKIDEASAMLQEANDRRLPDINISGNYLRLNSANIDLKTKSDSGGGNGGGIKVNQALYGTANLSFPLFAGGRIKYGIESAKFLKQASILDAENDREAVIYNTSSAYINLYKSYQAIIVVKENLHSSLSRDTNFINLEKNGLLARNDLLKSQLQTSNIELSLLDAESANRLAIVNLNIMLGLPENTQLAIDSNFINLKTDLKNFTDYENIALQSRKDLQALVSRGKATTTEIKSANAEAYPALALTGGYIAAYIPNVLTLTNAVNVGLGVQYNLASLYKKNTRLAQAKARQTQVSASQDVLTDAIRSQVNQDYQNVLLAERKIEVYEKALAQAIENYRITNNKYNNSLVTITDLLEADVALLQSKLNISFAKADAVLAYNKLLLTSGTIIK